MRTIKFRGKDLSSSVFVYGDLVQRVLADGTKKTSIVLTYETYDVIPETVGQFTGLFDKNGKEIYEGDIIWLYDVGIFYVIYNEERCKFELHDSDGFADKLWKLNTDRYEVIGNIYDNPELIH